MIISRGRGHLIAIITFAWLLALDWGVGSVFADREYYASHGWPKLVAFWGAAVTIYLARSFIGVPIVPTRDE